MGTGVGSGIVINGRILNGHHGIAGEWGHNVLSPDGPECYCGKRGCVETFISGPALEAWYEAKAKRHLSLWDGRLFCPSSLIPASPPPLLLQPWGTAPGYSGRHCWPAVNFRMPCCRESAIRLSLCPS